MLIKNSKCAKCKHQLKQGCKAYPNGIPYEISEGMVEHTELRGDEQQPFVYEEGEADIYNDREQI